MTRGGRCRKVKVRGRVSEAALPITQTGASGAQRPESINLCCSLSAAKGRKTTGTAVYFITLPACCSKVLSTIIRSADHPHSTVSENAFVLGTEKYHDANLRIIITRTKRHSRWLLYAAGIRCSRKNCPVSPFQSNHHY